MTLPNRVGYQVADARPTSNQATNTNGVARKSSQAQVGAHHPPANVMTNYPTNLHPSNAFTHGSATMSASSALDPLKGHFSGFMPTPMGVIHVQGPQIHGQTPTQQVGPVLGDFNLSAAMANSDKGMPDTTHLLEFTSSFSKMSGRSAQEKANSTVSSSRNSTDGSGLENFTPEELQVRKSYVRSHRLLPHITEVLNSCRKEGMLWEPKIDQTLITAMMPPGGMDTGANADQSIEDFLHSQGIETCPLNSEDPQKNAERQEFVMKLEQLKEKYSDELDKLDRVCNEFCFGMLNLLREQVSIRPVTDQETQMKILGIQYRFHNVKNKLRQNVFSAILQLHKQYNQSRKKKRMLPKKATESLSQWFFEHINDPYPSEEEKSHLASLAGLTLTQVNNWFGNKRIRYKRKCLEDDGKSRTRRGHNASSGSAMNPEEPINLMKDKTAQVY